MNYKEAIFNLFDTSGKEALNASSLARSYLLDLVGNDLYSKRLIDLLFIIYPVIDIADLFSKRNLADAREEMNLVYKSFSNLCTRKEYVDVINPISEYLNPAEYAESLKTKKLKKKSEPAKAEVVHVAKGKNKPEQNNNETISVAIKQPDIASRAAQKPTKSKRTTRQNFECFLGFINCRTLAINSSPNGKFGVFVDGALDSALTKSASLVSGIMLLHVDLPKSDVFINIPDKHYVEMVLNTDAKAVEVGNSKTSHLSFDKFKVEGKDTNVKAYLNADEIEINLHRGNFELEGSYQILNGKVYYGNANFKIHTDNYSAIESNWKAKYGNVIIKFLDGKVKPNLTSRIHFTDEVTKNGVVKQTLLKNNIKVGCGYILFE